MFSVSMKVEKRGLVRYRQTLDNDLNRNGRGPIGQTFDRWADSYFGQLFARFAQQPWTPLKASTIRAKGNSLVLIDTGTLAQAFNPRNRDRQIRRRIPGGIQVGLNPASHPKSSLNISELARIHHFGLGRVPRRPLFVPPSSELRRKFRSDMTDSLKKLGRDTGVGR